MFLWFKIKYSYFSFVSYCILQTETRFYAFLEFCNLLMPSDHLSEGIKIFLIASDK